MYVTIMAGGVGTRFWPKSRKEKPKQLLRIIGSRTMIQHAVIRLGNLVTSDNLFVVATAQQRSGILGQLPQLKTENLIIEPAGKNTAPCIGLAAIYLRRIDPKAVMAVMPADHLIGEDEKFRKTLKEAEQIALNDHILVTLGIRPTYPATGYGYIQCGSRLTSSAVDAFSAEKFIEKPDKVAAEKFLKDGNCFWNSGIFLWQVDTILAQFEKHLPELYAQLLEIHAAIGTPSEQDVLREVYSKIKPISLDYGIMEHSSEVIVLPADFSWNDLGTWDEVFNVNPKDANNNVIRAECVLKDVKNCYIDVDKKVVAAIGIENLVIVDTGDALLICRKDQSQRVRDIVDEMKARNMERLL